MEEREYIFGVRVSFPGLFSGRSSGFARVVFRIFFHFNFSFRFFGAGNNLFSARWSSAPMAPAEASLRKIIAGLPMFN
jgi:hypothetical protein